MALNNIKKEDFLQKETDSLDWKLKNALVKKGGWRGGGGKNLFAHFAANKTTINETGIKIIQWDAVFTYLIMCRLELVIFSDHFCQQTSAQAILQAANKSDPWPARLLPIGQKADWKWIWRGLGLIQMDLEVDSMWIRNSLVIDVDKGLIKILVKLGP